LQNTLKELLGCQIVGSNLYFTALISDDGKRGTIMYRHWEIELAGKRLFKLQQVQNTGTDYRLTNANDPCINEEQLR
jgi:hypothetical protein